jgi:hypothetical protein
MLERMDGRVLLFSVDPDVRWLGTRTLRGLGLEIAFADTWEKALGLLGDEPYDLVIFGPDHFALPKVERVIDELTNRKVKYGPVLITAQKSEHFLPLMRQYREVRHILAKQPGIEPVAFRALARKLLGGDLFGLDKYIDPSVDVHEIVIDDSTKKNEYIEEVAAFARRLTHDRGAIEGTEKVVDELVMNALFSAPHDGNKPRYLHLPRHQPIRLSAAEAGRLRYTCDGHQLYVSMSDPFGSLTADTLLAHIEARLSGVSEPLGESGGGGFGLFTAYQSVSSFVVNVAPGQRTEMITAIDLRHPYHEVRRMPRALDLYFTG